MRHRFQRMQKHIIAFALVCLMMIVMAVPAHADVGCKYDNFNKSFELVGDGGKDMVAVALAQNGMTRAQLGYDPRWCAAFVNDCAVLAGQQDAVPFISGVTHAVAGLYNTVLNRGGTVVSSPIPGDLVFYYCNSCGVFKHVGIYVGNYDGRNKVVVSGNVSNQVKLTWPSNYYIDDCGHTESSGVVSLEYVRPAYKTNSYGSLEIALSLNGAETTEPVGSFDLYINGALTDPNISGHTKSYPRGTTYKIENIKAADGSCYSYSGATGLLSGIIGANSASTVTLNFVFNGHIWKTVESQAPTCEEAGYINYQCANCSETRTETSDPVGHDWQESGRTEPSCQQVASITYTCSNCGKSYTQFADGDVSAWSETYPEGIREDLIETKTQYRYQDYTTTTSYETSLSGYDRVSSQWTKSGSSTYDYVAAWPAGFDTGNSFYAAYNKSPLTNSETQTDKIVVTGSSNGGYLLWHWCRGTYYNGPINRLIRDGWASDFGAFHAFYSDNNGSNTNPEGNNGGGEDVRYYYNSGCCTDTYWYFATEVTRQSYDAYRNLFTYGKWDNWSDWSDTVYSASDTRNVETRTVYRYVTAPLGEHNWDKGVVTKEATCIADGVKTFTCSLCGETKTEEIPKLGHAYSDNVCTRCGDVLMTVKVGAAEACAGESVKIPVVLSDNDGFTSFTLEILSDDALTLMNISKGTLLTSVRGIFSTTTDAGGGSVSWSGSSKITGDGVLMELTFTVSEDASVGAYAVNLKSSGDQTSSFMDENSKSIPMAFISGNVIVFPKATFTLPGNVTRIEEEAFAGNTAIAAVELPSGVKSIGARAFQNCSNMTMIVMDAGVTDIAADAFVGCSKDLLFCCPAGSYAQAYAESHGFRSIAP